LRRRNVNVRVLDGETVVLDRRRRRIHQLNVTASHVWARCDGRHSVREIAEDLAGAFEVDRPIAERDTAALLEQLARAGLLEDPATDPLHTVHPLED
jgi:hypothetical protein